MKLPTTARLFRTRTADKNTMKKGKKKGLVFFQGAFEIINYGHIRSFRRAKSEGSKLMVALNTNALLKKYKKRDAVLPWAHKASIIRSIRYVDQVIPIGTFSPLKLLKRYRPSVYVIGDEWIESKREEIAFMKSIGGRIVILPRYSGVVPTSEIKRRLLAEAKAEA
jgi:glycerol-3-phosphate cytidylyltransferase-like family protein